MATYGGSNIVLNGLILNLDAANSISYISGSTSWNSRVGSITGSLVNGPTFNSANGGAIVFDGVNDYANFGDVPALDNAFTQITVIAWINPSQLPPTETLFLGKMGAAGNRGFQFAISSSAKINTTYFNSAAGTGYFLESANTVPINTFMQVAYTFIASTSETLYINDAVSKVNTTSVSNAFNGSNSSNFQVGQRGDLTAGGYFNGAVASVQIYNRALSSPEILQNYNALKSRFNL